MGFLNARVAGRRRVAIDTKIYLLADGPQPYLAGAAAELFGLMESGALRGVLSVVSVAEVLVRPYRLNRPDLARHYLALLKNFPGLTLAEVSVSVAALAAELRSRYRRLKMPDALVVATALIYRCDALVTNDISNCPTSLPTSSSPRFRCCRAGGCGAPRPARAQCR